MAIRLVCPDESTAAEYAELLTHAGYAAEQEPDPLGQAHVVTTDASVEIVGDLVEDGSGVVVEVSDPMSGTSAGVPAEDLPTDQTD